MSNREHRIAGAIDSLIAHLVPSDPDEDEAVTQERYDNCFELVNAIIHGPASSSLSSDVNHASDLIKRKLIQTNPTQALRFSNLYTRLLSLPVLNQKWAILHLLYQLADSPDPNEPLPLNPLPPPLSQPQPQSQRQSQSSSRSQHDSSSRRKEEARSSRATSSVSRSTLLADSYTQTDPSETALLRDLPFTLQGLSSTTLPFPKRDSNDILVLPPTLPAPMISLLHTLAEPSLLYRRLDAFVKSPAQGLLRQSLRAAVGRELRAYLTLVATLEGQIRHTLSTLDEGAPKSGIGKAGVTLKRCVVWTREATMGLRLMSLLAEESENKRGGQLISLIHGFSSSHGDPVVAAFAERLLVHVTKPFYDMLRRWIYDGELLDPYCEFFVKEPGAATTRQREDGVKTGGGGGAVPASAAGNVWEDKYHLDADMIPTIVTRDFAQKVFLIGKSLNFIRHSCRDSQWVDDYSKGASKELRYGDIETLEAWIDEAYKTTMQRLIHLMADKFHVFEHLQALKDYILLGQGDFIALLMESLAANLDRPAGAQYRHTLTAQLEHAIRGSNAQFDSPEVLRRLDARMLQLSHGDIGWDCFTLEYKIDAPVDVVVTDWGNRQYLKVFNFLWRIKRVEFALASTWRKSMTGARGVLQNTDPDVLQTWKSTRAVLAEMIHFVGQLQYYILFEVIESSWGELQSRIRREGCTLDDLIKAHTRYLNDITHKGLLGAKRVAPRAGGPQYPSDPNNPSASSSSSASAEDDRTSYLAQLGDLLRTMLAYRDSVDGLYSWSVSDFTRRQEADLRFSSAQRRHRHRPSTLDDEGAHTPTPGTSAVASELPLLQDRLRQLATSFRSRLQILLGDLAYQPDVDMRFLGVSMNFNDVYQPARRKLKVPSSAAPGSASISEGKAAAGSSTAGKGQRGSSARV
ncbi:hypothetical protein ACRALDRAFT_1047822 [Sodiomyces alcalophilus JCM 7366]|uniref:uncharacterized protein n=1 Tax=Sodiomyces alcalophilus JCM 7366 TaxID=591952 RepID=UPI0039B4A039